MRRITSGDWAKILSLIGLMLLAVAIFGTSWIMLMQYIDNWQERGQFGDMFGSVNALFSALAFAGIVFAIVLQMKDLSAQQDELRLTREELKGQKQQMEKQNETWIRQGFESSFFEMLSLHNQLVTSLTFHKREGRNCFKGLSDEIGKRLKGSSDLNEWTTVEQNYQIVFLDFPPDISNYFRILYNMLKLVKQSRIDNKKDYTNLVRALLTQNELVVILYNCIGPYGKRKFKPLVEEFAILKHINPESLVSFDHIGFFKQSAFEESAYVATARWSKARLKCTLNGETLDD